MHITLTGNLGSGKSTVCKRLEQEYGYEIFSTGKIIRQIADEMGISVLEMNDLMTKDHKYDKMIDDASARISRENPQKNILFDSRLAWNFVESSFKVFLSVDLSVAAMRVFSDAKRGKVESYKSVEEAKEQLRMRAENEDRRYRELYRIDYFDFNNYNLILDSSYASPELVSEVLFSEAKRHTNDEDTGRILISPKRLGYSWEREKNEQAPYYPSEEVLLLYEGGEFKIFAGEETVRAAAAQGIPFVAARLKNSRPASVYQMESSHI